MANPKDIKINGSDAKQFDPDTANGAVIIIAYGSDGLDKPWDETILGLADALSGKGFLCLIPDYLKSDYRERRDLLHQIPAFRPAWEDVISDTINYAAAQPTIEAGRIGLLGFSLGGYLCLRVRAKAKVAVEFFAPHLDEESARGRLTHAQIHHGCADGAKGCAFLSAEAIAQMLRAEGTDTKLWPYENAGHGFIGPTGVDPNLGLGGTDEGNTKARFESKMRTIEFFEANL